MPNRNKSWLLLLLMVVISTVFLTGFDDAKRVVIRYDGHRKVVNTNLHNPVEIIKSAGITMDKDDQYEILGVNQIVEDGSIIQVLRAKSFVIHNENGTKEFVSTKQTIGEALKDIGISPKKNNIYPKIDSTLDNNTHIYLIKKDEKFIFAQIPVEAPVEYREDYNLAFGTEQIIYDGRPGSVTIVCKSCPTEDGSFNVIELFRKENIKPEVRIVSKGMGMSVHTPNGYKRYTKKLRCEATAYIATGNPTATGIMPYWGVIAVDPRVIPLGTKVYIPNYGVALAADTGGAVKGNIIDLFMHTYGQAINWGRRDVDVYILSE